MPKVDAEKLERLERLGAQARARDNAASARQRTSKRKQDTRRKVILGSLLIDAAQTDPYWRPLLDQLMRRIIREQDQRAFAGWELDVGVADPPAAAPAVASATAQANVTSDARPRWKPSAFGHAPFSWD